MNYEKNSKHINGEWGMNVRRWVEGWVGPERVENQRGTSNKHEMQIVNVSVFVVVRMRQIRIM